MKTILNKSTRSIAGQAKRVFTLSAVAAIAAVPFLGVTHTAQADPPRRGWEHRDKNRNDRRNDRWDRRNRYESFSGTVTKISGSRNFDLRVGGKTYNVYTNDRLPRGVDRGDVVRVYGERNGNNDIRNARVTLIRNIR